jgi:SPP1 family predicted phage head-tail adaptor
MNKRLINAGKFRHRITIRNAPLDSSRDTFGRRKGSGTTVCTVWAEKQDWAGGEITEGKREIASVSTRWMIRYRTDVKPEMEVVHGSDVYNIISIMDFDGRTRELVLTTRRIDSE